MEIVPIEKMGAKMLNDEIKALKKTLEIKQLKAKIRAYDIIEQKENAGFVDSFVKLEALNA